MDASEIRLGKRSIQCVHDDGIAYAVSLGSIADLPIDMSFVSLAHVPPAQPSIDMNARRRKFISASSQLDTRMRMLSMVVILVFRSSRLSSTSVGLRLAGLLWKRISCLPYMDSILGFLSN